MAALVNFTAYQSTEDDGLVAVSRTVRVNSRQNWPLCLLPVEG